MADAARATPVDHQRTIHKASELEARIAATGFSGVAAVASEGELIFTSVQGLANRETGEPITVKTRFALASVPKMITAIAIMQLVEDGKVSLDDPIGKHLPDYPNRTIREDATVRHLMKMRSGLGDYLGSEHDRALKAGKLNRLSDYLPLFQDDPLAFAPGTGFEYSNAGYILLGRIIEVRSGQSYFSYIDENILRPARMDSTMLAEAVDVRPGIAVGYRVEGLEGIAESEADLAGRKLVPNTQVVAGPATSAGGGYSTVGDFARLAHSLRTEQLLRWDSLAEILGDRFGEGVAPGGLAGGAPGVTALFRLLPDGRTIVAMGNKDVPSAIEIGRMIETHLKEGSSTDS
ncbi:serine hydrolase [Erythrobacter sp. sf7]|uniref:Serine hydrolase n=2 Tax=Erythrobacter fulvus TaxID=2987523 RepID=A0ABT5JR11_9SPHN|nr:serine hydrolase [Erythrobacter fulvus]